MGRDPSRDRRNARRAARRRRSQVETEAGSVELPAYLYAGIRQDVVAIPLGQGHTAYGRYAKGRGVNALALLSPAQDAASGAVAYLSAKAQVSQAAPRRSDLVMTQREKNQRDREHRADHPGRGAARGRAGGVARRTARRAHGARRPAHGAASGDTPRGAPPIRTRRRPARQVHRAAPSAPERPSTPAHAVTAVRARARTCAARARSRSTRAATRTPQHRWAMAIDLNSCTGCSACVVACNAENNIPIVGPELIKRGREMMWIRIERYEERVAPGKIDVRFVPMMCQHCGDAPCETVCPVYATYHNPEGLNAQVYNRCVGTRYCSNNCPYKVRAFNLFDYAAPEKATFAFPEPLNWQLNPDVTVRYKGVMEKCTFCIQRILEGKGNAQGRGARAAGRRDPDRVRAVVPDAGDRVRRPDGSRERGSRSCRHGERRYWVLNELNTKPGVTYLKKVDARRGVQEHGVTRPPRASRRGATRSADEHVPATRHAEVAQRRRACG